MRVQSFRRILRTPQFRLSAANLIAQFIFLAATPIYSRLFSPAEFGQAASIVVLIQILAVGAALRYDVAILNTKSDRLATSILLISVLSLISFSILVSMVSIIWWVFHPGSDTVSFQALFFVPAGVFCISLYQIGSYWLTRQKSYDTIALSRVFQAVVGAFIPVAMYQMEFGFSAIVFGALASRCLGLLVFLLVIRRPIDMINARSRSYDLATIAKKLRSFPFFAAPQAFINVASMALAPVILTFTGWAQLAGQLWVVERFMLGGLAVFGVSFGQVLLGQLKGQRQAKSIRDDVIRSHVNMIYVGPVFVFFVGYFLYLFSGDLLGEEWKTAGEIAAILILPAIAQFLASPLSVIVGLLGENRHNLYIQLFAFLVRLLPLYILCLTNISFAIPAYAICTTVCYVIYTIWLLRLSEIKFKYYVDYTRRAWAVALVLVALVFVFVSILKLAFS